MVRGEAPILSEIIAADGYQLPEVASALKGRVGSLQRRSADGEDVLTVAVPVQGYRAIIGALMCPPRPARLTKSSRRNAAWCWNSQHWLWGSA